MKASKLCRLLIIHMQLDNQTNQWVRMKDKKYYYTKAGQTGDVDSSSSNV